eukprot:GILJ01002448.1.p1 GENE.GILJ01002448.1~~GILJ01002448.1.p1  ORF type:complete len:970 (+),score=139.62 GILJ01002448.1:429-3338(+)
MDYVEGITLLEFQESLSPSSSLSAAQLDHLLQQLSRILYVLAHARIVHADIHPGNIMLTPEGRLVVIDLERGCVCGDLPDFSFGQKLYIPFDARFSKSIHKDTCVSTDAYAMGVTILGLVAKVTDADAWGGSSLLNFRAVALQRLRHATLPGDDTMTTGNPLRLKLQRLLTALLEDHGAARTAATYATLADPWIKTTLPPHAEGTSLSFTGPESDQFSENDPERIAFESGSDLSHDSALDQNESIQEDIQQIATESAAQQDGYSKTPSAAPGLHEPSFYSSGYVEKNGILSFLGEVNKETFPPGDSILSRRIPHWTYVPNGLFHLGLHHHADANLKESVVYNVFLLQRSYRFKLTLQRTTVQSTCGTYRLLDSDPLDPMLVAVDTASTTAGDVTSSFSFEGQPLASWLDDWTHGKTLIHASLSSWDGTVIVGGCLSLIRSAHRHRLDTDIDATGLTVLKIEDGKQAVRGVYSFIVGGEEKNALRMVPPKVVVVGGGPAGLYAAMQAKASAAAVTVWEMRDGYKRLYCQACAVTTFVENFNMATEKYLKSVEEVLASIVMTIGVNLQFNREFLWLDGDTNEAFARVVTDKKWHGREPWEKLKNEWSSSEDLVKEKFDVLIGAEGSNSRIRSEFLKSSFKDRKNVVLNTKTDFYQKRILKRKSGKPIKSVSILQFFKHQCRDRQHMNAKCVHVETAFNGIWNVQQHEQPSCFFEYIENEIGLARLRSILKKHNLQEDVTNYGKPFRTHPAAEDDVYHMLLARYISVNEHLGHNDLKLLTLTPPDESEQPGCTYQNQLRHQALHTHFKSLENRDLFSMFWIHTRSAKTFAASTAKGAVVAIVGDATRDSFFPNGNGLNEHLDVINSLGNPTDSSSSIVSPTKASSIGALVRKEIDSTVFNAHMSPRIKSYIDDSSLDLLSSISCMGDLGERYTVKTAADRMHQYAVFAEVEPKETVLSRCPFLEVIDIPNNV